MHSAVINRRIVEHIQLDWAGLQSLKTHLNQQSIPFRISDVRFGNAITSSLGCIHLTQTEHFRIRHFDLVRGIFRFALDPTLAVGDNKLQQARVGFVDCRVINLVKNPIRP